MIVADQSEVIAFLSRPDTYGSGVSRVEQVETHISVVFLAHRAAFKLKRAVRFPYLDFSTLDARRRYCEAEVRINRRTAPDLYRGVVAVTRRPDGGLRLGGAGAVVEWLVAMRRFDEDELLDRLAQQGRLDRIIVEDLADRIARFHAEAEPRPQAGGRALIGRVIDSNDACLAEIAADVLDRDRVRTLTARSRQALDQVGGLLDRRRDGGRVRHCHGDLHLRNIVLHEGRPTLFDAIEFDPALADIDVLYDLAFLVMDLDHRGLTDLASVLLNRYLDDTGDADGLAALPLLLSLRAAIRSHVEAAAAVAQTDPGAAAARLDEARRYLADALDDLARVPPRLIAIGGLSGSGKSRLARALAPLIGSRPGARVVRTDTTRKRLAGVAVTDRLGPENYTPAMSARTYAAVFDECLLALVAGRAVIADAVFARPAERQRVAALAAAAGVPFAGLWLEAPPSVLVERVTTRTGDASDADAAVVSKQLDFDIGGVDWPRLATDRPEAETVAAARALLAI